MASKRTLRGHLADLLVGLAVTAALLGLAEAGLWAFGVADPAGELDFSRGFDPRAAYIVPDRDVPGGWRTQFAEGKLQEVIIPPRDGRTRVLLFGGSNTDNFPAAYLEALLNEEAPRFEVINLGRSGYGSGRVSIVLEQALALLDPDVVVVYSGHNEFVEQSFELDLEQQWSGPFGHAVGRWAARSRVVTAVVGLLDEPAQAPPPKRPEAWAWEYDKFEGLSWEETLEAYERYRRNLELMCRQARERGVEVVLCTVVHNHFAPPFESTPPTDWSAEQQQDFLRLRRSIRAAFPTWLEALAPRRARDRVISRDWHVPPDERRVPPLPPDDTGSRTCFGPLAEASPGRPASRRWSEKTWRLLEALDALWSGDLESERGSLEQLEARLREALKAFPEHPDSHFELGLVGLALRHDEGDVVAHLDAAARHDRAPRKGNGATNGIVRQVAAAVEGVVLVDAQRIFRERMPMGLVGWEWMSDHCHLNKGARKVFMADLAEVLRNRAR